MVSNTSWQGNPAKWPPTPQCFQNHRKTENMSLIIFNISLRGEYKVICQLLRLQNIEQFYNYLVM